MSSLCGPTIAGKARRQRLDDLARVVDRQRRLRHIGEVLGDRAARARATSSSVSTSVMAPGGSWPMVPTTSGWPAWPIEDHVAPAPVMDLGLAMDLRDQRAGGVDGEEPPRRRPPAGTDFGTPWAEKITGAAVVGHLVELAHEHGALRLQALDHVLVVDDLVADIDRRRRSARAPARRRRSPAPPRRRSRAARRAGCRGAGFSGHVGRMCERSPARCQAERRGNRRSRHGRAPRARSMLGSGSSRGRAPLPPESRHRHGQRRLACELPAAGADLLRRGGDRRAAVPAPRPQRRPRLSRRRRRHRPVRPVAHRRARDGPRRRRARRRAPALHRRARAQAVAADLDAPRHLRARRGAARRHASRSLRPPRSRAGSCCGAPSSSAIALALSATSIALQMLEERGDLQASYGQRSFAILLFQDLSIAPILALMPLLATAGGVPRARRQRRHADRRRRPRSPRLPRSSSSGATASTRSSGSSPRAARAR